MPALYAAHDDLLTAREVQDLLKIDRTTVYRMLKGGRLTGVKVGQQWRFPRGAVDALLAGEGPEPPPGGEDSLLAIHCVQSIQELFAAMAGVGVATLAPGGAPLTQPSGPYRPPDDEAVAGGLNWADARVEVCGVHAATIIAGPFLVVAAPAASPSGIPQLDKRGRERLEGWLRQAALTFESIGSERAAVVDRLRRIAALTELVPSAAG